MRYTFKAEQQTIIRHIAGSLPNAANDHSIGQPKAASPRYVKSELDNNNPGLGRGHYVKLAGGS